MFFGYVLDEHEMHGPPTHLEDKKTLITFIKQHYQAPGLLITDTGDQQILLMHDGVDLFNDLSTLGIDLSEVFKEIREEIQSNSQKLHEKPEWEKQYDAIGLSPGEIRMRQRVKRACREAKTISDVAKLVKGTYFDAYFETKDGKWRWGYFDESDFSASMFRQNGQEIPVDQDIRQKLPPEGKVAYQQSSEDIHRFYLLDPPPEIKA